MTGVVVIWPIEVAALLSSQQQNYWRATAELDMTVFSQPAAFLLTEHLYKDWLSSASRNRSYNVFWPFLFLHTRENGLAPRSHYNLRQDST